MMMSPFRRLVKLRLSFRTLVLFIFLGPTALWIVLNWTRCSHDVKRDLNSEGLLQHGNAPGIKSEFEPYSIDPAEYRSIECIVNGEYRVSCHQSAKDVYVPFSFLAKYLELFGKVLQGQDGSPYFEWRHSTVQVFYPSEQYSPEGVYMFFENYNVELRDRVMCISGTEDVPLSNQWSADGYFYPIQIAQYGLSHYSKYLRNSSREVLLIEDAERGLSPDWRSGEVKVETVFDSRSAAVKFNEEDDWSQAGAVLEVSSLKARKQDMAFLTMDVKFASNGSIEVVFESRKKHSDKLKILYAQTNTTVGVLDQTTVIIGIGERRHWSRMTRNVMVDLQKGLASAKTSSPRHVRNKAALSKVINYYVSKVIFHGNGWVDNITLTAKEHLWQFYSAANWLVLHQDNQGGWPIQVRKELAAGVLQLEPGWYSAMAQGQAMSLLVRAYVRTNNKKYLTAALKATQLFSVPSEDGGVRTLFSGKFVWYEEYPTIPSSFVLNGFIYSLFGLYDLKTVTERQGDSTTNTLFQEGLLSLKQMLPLFDTGSGSVYDLRHFSLGTAPNLARWEYHEVHINQLLALATVMDDSIFKSTANRWISYSQGRRAAHN